jgi:hypothetical protein
MVERVGGFGEVDTALRASTPRRRLRRPFQSRLISYNACVNKSRLIPLMVVRDETVVAARAATQEFLALNDDVVEDLNRVVFAHHALGNLIPETVETFFSGHAFPYWAAQMELETSVQLAQEAFYTQAFATVRSMLELDLLGVYFAVEDRAHEAVKDWLRSRERTPSMRVMLNHILSIPALEIVDRSTGLREEMLTTYDELSAYVHTRGYRFSAQGVAGHNVNTFTEEAFRAYVRLLTQSTGYATTALVGKYLVGMQPLPLDEKFGLNGPAGGFLREHEVERLKAVLPDDVRQLLQDLSVADPDVQAAVEHFEGLPDLTEEEHRKQQEEWGALFEKHRAVEHGESRETS